MTLRAILPQGRASLVVLHPRDHLDTKVNQNPAQIIHMAGSVCGERRR